MLLAEAVHVHAVPGQVKCGLCACVNSSKLLQLLCVTVDIWDALVPVTCRAALALKSVAVSHCFVWLPAALGYFFVAFSPSTDVASAVSVKQQAVGCVLTDSGSGA